MKDAAIERLIAEAVAFRDERDWKQFHDAKNLALGLSIEAAELNECFLWKSAGDAKLEKVREELADVLVYCLLLLEYYDLDIEEIVTAKLALNRKKYPIEKSKGRATKWNELDD